MNNNNEVISLQDLAKLFLGKIWILILAILIGGGIGFSYAKFRIPLKYSSHISMYVQSYKDLEDDNSYQQNNISNSKQLINTYMEVLKDDAVMRKIGEDLYTKFSSELLESTFSVTNGVINTESLKNTLSISSVTDTSALKITVTSKNAEISAFICNDLAAIAPEFIDNAVGVGSIHTIDTAKVYPDPVAPNVPKTAAMAAFAALALCMMIIFLVDFFDNTVKEPEVLNEKFQKPVFGEIPEFEQQKKNKKKRSTDVKRNSILDQNVPFQIVENFKAVRTNLVFGLAPYQNKIIAVSSCVPGEGKTTISLNVAITMAQSDHKVLLIGGDLRKPVLYKSLNLENKKGFSNIISNQGSFKDCVKKEFIPNLDILTSGPIPPNPSELLSSEHTKVFLEEIQKDYDYIIIDTPPINVVSDGLVLAPMIAGLVLVTRFGSTDYDSINEALKKIELSNMNLLGFICNCIPTKSRSYGKYGKYDYKKYGYEYKSSSDTSKINEPQKENKKKDKK